MAALTTVVRFAKPSDQPELYVERAKGFEPSTSTLATSRPPVTEVLNFQDLSAPRWRCKLSCLAATRRCRQRYGPAHQPATVGTHDCSGSRDTSRSAGSERGRGETTRAFAVFNPQDADRRDVCPG